MRILVLGGTRFVGRHFVAAALARGHRVTLVHRGLTNPELFPEAERVIADRETDLGPLAGRVWDACADVSGYLPRVVGRALAALRGSVARYLFVSTISVYADTTTDGIAEDAPLRTMPEGADQVVGPETYGALKAGCEEAVREAFGEQAAIVRPGLVLGPHDPTDRSGYWPRRFARGGEVLAPGHPGRRVQYVDARDLGAWMVRVLEDGRAGTFNATGPAAPLDMRGWLEACAAAAGATAAPRWVDEGFLLERGVGTFFELPLWVEEGERVFGGVDCRRALAAGLTFRPPLETARDVLAWQRARPGFPDPPPPGSPFPSGMSAEREAVLLGEWKARPAAV